MYENTGSDLMSAYRPDGARNTEYMTLSAHMNIRDDCENVPPAERRKPEVALVTSDVDLNFTVNHAYPRGAAARRDSAVSADRGEDELDLPRDATLEIPTRSVEETMLHY
jgi:hypothetical protein